MALEPGDLVLGKLRGYIAWPAVSMRSDYFLLGISWVQYADSPTPLTPVTTALLKAESIDNRVIGKGHSREMKGSDHSRAPNTTKVEAGNGNHWANGLKFTEMAQADTRLTAIENFSGMTIDYLVFSKLAKV
ncbi:hypothetical protein B0H11DRAFT_1905195 [Mycena galericulata]|nr:hypothetical protein B0H11DRAFT_1905195 [Mycena galericulata]